MWRDIISVCISVEERDILIHNSSFLILNLETQERLI